MMATCNPKPSGAVPYIRAMEMPVGADGAAVTLVQEVVKHCAGDRHTCIAGAIKKRFDEKLGPNWHCVVGKEYGCFVSHKKNHFIYIQMDELVVLLFKAKPRADFTLDQGQDKAVQILKATNQEPEKSSAQKPAQSTRSFEVIQSAVFKAQSLQEPDKSKSPLEYSTPISSKSSPLSINLDDGLGSLDQYKVPHISKVEIKPVTLHIVNFKDGDNLEMKPKSSTSQSSSSGSSSSKSGFSSSKKKDLDQGFEDQASESVTPLPQSILNSPFPELGNPMRGSKTGQATLAALSTDISAITGTSSSQDNIQITKSIPSTTPTNPVEDKESGFVSPKLIPPHPIISASTSSKPPGVSSSESSSSDSSTSDKTIDQKKNSKLSKTRDSLMLQRTKKKKGSKKNKKKREGETAEARKERKAKRKEEKKLEKLKKAENEKKKMVEDTKKKVEGWKKQREMEKAIENNKKEEKDAEKKNKDGSAK